MTFTTCRFPDTLPVRTDLAGVAETACVGMTRDCGPDIRDPLLVCCETDLVSARILACPWEVIPLEAEVLPTMGFFPFWEVVVVEPLVDAVARLGTFWGPLLLLVVALAFCFDILAGNFVPSYLHTKFWTFHTCHPTQTFYLAWRPIERER